MLRETINGQERSGVKQRTGLPRGHVTANKKSVGILADFARGSVPGFVPAILNGQNRNPLNPNMFQHNLLRNRLPGSFSS
jgi:hypothetical protein